MRYVGISTNTETPYGGDMTETVNTESTERADLSWLKDATPTKTKMRTSRRGRQPGDNPVAGHLKAAYDSGETLSLNVPATVARQVERQLRRAGNRENWTVSVQVISGDPASATSDDVVALKDLGTLPEGSDVWVLFSATDKTENDADAGESADENDAPADPFKDTPNADAGESADENATPAPKTGRRSGRKATV